MKNKFTYLIKHSLKKKINTKWFKVVNVLLGILLVFLINIDYVINLFGGDFENKEKIYVVDNADSYEMFKNYFTVFAKSLELNDYELILDQDILNNKDNIDEEIVVLINTSVNEYLTSEIISYNTVTRTTYEVIVNSLNAVKGDVVLKASGLSSEEIAKLTEPIKVTETVLNEKAHDNKTKENLSSIITTVVIVPFFILIVTMVQMLGAEINDEKTSRGMEIIISSIPVKMHFLSKVIAALTFVLIQGVLLFVYGFLGILVRNMFTTTNTTGVGTMFKDIITMISDAGVFDLLLKGSIVLIILYITSFIAYACISATLASMTTNNEDFQQLQAPLMITMLVGYYIALMAVFFDGALFIHITAYIPLLSVLIAPTLYLLGEMSLLSLICTTLVTCIATYLVYVYGLKIYKVGILNYSSSKLWRKMFKSLKNK